MANFENFSEVSENEHSVFAKTIKNTVTFENLIKLRL